ncbi:NAD(P)-dependent oxidoreductase [Candidatus Bathyarchaeota archaeon]|nr:NAD(P)-dependent oxidoreductase [Candidatus Bathyarchaeota archaeon]
MKRIGFIGLGLMGSGMSLNLVKAGFSVTVWNRTSSKTKPLVEAGANAATSPKAVAENSDVIITIVTDGKDVEMVLLGPNGVHEGVKPGAVIIDMSTISPIKTREIARKLREKGAIMLDAPVSGGDVGARNGTLSIMVGGPKETFQEVLPIFEAMGKTITHIGDVGSGQATKAVNQILVGINMLAVAEALMFAKKAGIDLQKCYNAISGGAAGSWQLTNNGMKLLKNDLEPGFKVKDYIKDLRIIMETAQETKTPLLGTSLVQQLFRNLDAEKMNNKGTQALITVIENLAGEKFTN